MARTTGATFRPKRKSSKTKVTPPRQTTKSKRTSINTKASRSVASQKSTAHSRSTRSASQKASLTARTPVIAQASGKHIRRRGRSQVVKQIRFYQNNIANLTQRAPLIRTLKQILLEDDHNIKRFSSSAIEVLQESLESFLVSAASSGNDLVRHAKRVTLMKKDLELAVKLMEQGPLFGSRLVFLLSKMNSHRTNILLLYSLIFYEASLSTASFFDFSFCSFF